MIDLKKIASIKLITSLLAWFWSWSYQKRGIEQLLSTSSLWQQRPIILVFIFITVRKNVIKSPADIQKDICMWTEIPRTNSRDQFIPGYKSRRTSFKSKKNNNLLSQTRKADIDTLQMNEISLFQLYLQHPLSAKHVYYLMRSFVGFFLIFKHNSPDESFYFLYGIRIRW